MALGNNNPLIQKVTGTLGETIVFKDYGGKTVISKKPRPSSKPPSPEQLRVRRIFKVAQKMAQQLLTDPEELERYKSIAKSRNSPNALTAARRDALRTIFANPSDFEELIAEATIGEAPGLPVTESPATSVHANPPANTFDALLAAGGNMSASAGNASHLTQQLADVTNALNHCLQELQKTMAKATEMLQAINVVNASANGRTSGTTDAADETSTPHITTPSEIITSSIPSPFTETQTTAPVNDRRQQSPIKSSTRDILSNGFQRYYFPFPGIQQHLSIGMLDKIAIIIQGNAPRVHYNPR